MKPTTKFARWPARGDRGRLRALPPAVVVDDEEPPSPPAVVDPPAVPEAAPEAAVNAGNVDEVLERVGDDVELAVQVIAAEQASSRPRTSLIAALEQIVSSEADDDPSSEGNEPEPEAEVPAEGEGGE